MTLLNPGKQVIKYCLGYCLPSVKENAAKIRIKRLKLDEYLLMYFSDFEFVYAYDPKKICKPGDTVLVQNLPEKMTRLITHKVIEIIYPFGDVVDPITGKKVVKSQYRDWMKRTSEMYGEWDNAFDYDTAPPRGSQEDKRDFSHKDPVVRYHDDPDNPQPEAS
ncbi:hypothetical protein PV325_002754 [Microctonus aethiopoides]|uniref:Mitochondrial ribosomal protein S17 n=1 Tax=Microctonus aethiopoides TaxID=144406 RepID=A0AA39FHX0_9HYME|nr:hypothetical protein PV325_002754 [Microctonus aethiopoides]KAK0091069.1 hypothetical protein PV326_003807 [Microctonus aethiopoides]KAK0169889.1 hypothetical protein PV328_010523 [Microctonus aethiopoides]